MNDTNIVKYRRDVIGSFIKLRNIGTDKESLHIRYDDLIMMLLDTDGIKFTPSKFEELLTKEINAKVLKKPFNQEIFNRLCDYIWELAVYCTSMRIKDERNTTRILEDRARRKREERIR